MKSGAIKFLKVLAFVFIISGIVISIIYLLLIFSGLISDDKTSFLQSTSIAGDFIGGVVGSLWSLAGVLLFYIALTYQTKEIKNQEAQIALQRDELQNQITELKETRDVFLLQNFENTFFNLLRNQRELTNQIECEINFRGAQQKLSGVNFFNFGKIILHKTYDFFLPEDKRKGDLNNIYDINNIYENRVDLYTRAELIRPMSDDLIRIRNCYEIFNIRFSDFTNHYFRHLYSVLNFIKQHENEIMKYRSPKDYSQLLKSQMTLAELFITFYNGLYFPKMKVLLEDYNILKNLYVDDLMSKDHEAFYKTGFKTKFEERPKTDISH